MITERYERSSSEPPPSREQVEKYAVTLSGRIVELTGREIADDELQRVLRSCTDDSTLKKWAARIAGVAALLAAIHALPGKRSREATMRTVPKNATEFVQRVVGGARQASPEEMGMKDQSKEELLLLYGDVPVIRLPENAAPGPILERLQKKYKELGLDQFLHELSWYANEDFYKKLGLKFEWRLITKKCIPNSTGKEHHWEQGDVWKPEKTQEHVIEQFARDSGIQRTRFHRPEPCQMLYATALHLVATEKLQGKGKGERLLKGEYHWSDVISSDVYFVYVGRADVGGAYVHRYSRDNSDDSLGVCLSRDPSWSKSLNLYP